jgi:hypothetical protein
VATIRKCVKAVTLLAIITRSVYITRTFGIPRRTLVFYNQANAYPARLIGTISIEQAYTISYVPRCSTISVNNRTRVQDLHTLLRELEINSQFGDLSVFAQPEQSSEAPSTISASSSLFVTQSEAPPASLPIYPPLSSQGPPNQFLINLAVLAASTRLRVDPWHGTTGYIQFISLHHWHPSFGIEFAAFLTLVLTELQDRLPEA